MSMHLFQELRRRNVFKVAGVYLVTGFLVFKLVSGISTYLQSHLPYDIIALILLAIGFPIACLYAWAFEITPNGLKRTDDVLAEDSISKETGRKLNYILCFLLFIAFAFILYLKFSDKSPLVSEMYFETSIIQERLLYYVAHI